ncbi:anthranilate synthase component I family protein [Helicobacter sp. 11S02629-2]|uniref:anthranilate synthase component I family protein n=1 Tax=Helicobacter sp. 11S02629-2 TaxID=1476195 RepID=UPI000BA7B58E|nr:anthranilate synthase component I family protein [Helicobacter sp. 11S02629-2]PAF44591.1 hypothetical protein BKH40_04990 [Helicobacter sp. 11S02629-2]
MKYCKQNGSMLTPILVFKKLDAKILLESASLHMGKGRFSIIVKDIAFKLVLEKDSTFLKVDSKSYCLDTLENLEGIESTHLALLTSILKHKALKLEAKKHESDEKKNLLLKEYKGLDFLDYVGLMSCVLKEDSSLKTKEEIAELEALPLPFGGLGYLGYEFFSQVEEISFTKKGLYEAPTCQFIYGKEYVIFDHLYDEFYLITTKYSKLSLEDLKALLEKPYTPKTEASVHSEIVSKSNKSWYMSGVEAIKKEIYKGTFLQCVLSRSISIKSNLNPLSMYERLRRANPSPYMYYLDLGELTIIGASPEVMLKCEGKVLTLRPIAGSAKRGASLEEDKQNELDLLADVKESAEHLMLVDLGRNDLGRVSKEVKMNAFRVIEKYSKIMHIVSEVSGTLREGITSKDALKASFPAGTVSGAPKVEAVKFLERIEPHARKIYAGAIGYFKSNDDLDSAIALRTAVYKDGIYYLQAGAGIVMDSDPLKEYIETNTKLGALLQALEVKVED